MPDGSILIGIDVGTSALKVVAINDEGVLVRARQAPTPTTAFGDGRAEHDPDALWGVTASLVRKVVETLPAGTEPIAVATASMGEAGLPVDHEGHPLRPMIGWQDARTRSWAEWWEQAIGGERILQISGHALDAHFGISKLLWVREFEPAIFARTRRWLSAADLITSRLSGVAATDHSLASRTMVFDQRRREWSCELLDVAELEPDLFPPAYPAGTVVGEVRADAARETAIAPGLTVVLGGHDRLCGAFAARGGTDDAVDSAGTAETVVVPTERYQGGDRAGRTSIPCYCDVVPGQYAWSARVGPAGALVEWARRVLFADGEVPVTHEEMFGELRTPVEFSGLICVPTFGRPATPWWNPATAYGALVGLTMQHTRGNLFQALLEGVCFSVRANVEALSSLLDRPLPTLRVEGGIVRSDPWLQLRADVLGRELCALEIPQAAALGAALLAGVGAGCFPDHASASAAACFETRTWFPNARRAENYDRAFRSAYLPLLTKVAPVHHALRELEGIDPDARAMDNDPRAPSVDIAQAAHRTTAARPGESGGKAGTRGR